MLDRAPPWTTPAKEPPKTHIIELRARPWVQGKIIHLLLFLVFCLFRATWPAFLTLFHQQEIGEEKEELSTNNFGSLICPSAQLFSKTLTTWAQMKAGVKFCRASRVLVIGTTRI